MKSISKYIGSLIVIILAGSSATAQTFRLIPDSLHVYSYNRADHTTTLSGVTYNYYSGLFPDSTYTTDKDRVTTSKALYTYSDGVITEALSFINVSGTFMPNQRREFFYEHGYLVSGALVTKWVAGQWQNLNRFTYVYDENNRLTVYGREYWKDNSWIDFSADSLFYSADGRLTEQRARSSISGQFVTRNLLSYSAEGLKVNQVRQDYINNGWINVSRTLYYYNKCGTQTSTESERWIDGTWQPDSRTEVFFHAELMPGTRKVPVCHNGKTVYIKAITLPGHLAHGDCLGECIEPAPVKNTDNTSVVNKSLPFVVYPNPARESLSVRILDVNCPVSRVELIDYYGRVLRSVLTGDQYLIFLDISDLKSGNYFLRVTSDTVYSTTVTKK